MNKHRIARMLTSMRATAFLAAVLVIGFATVAQGDDGGPLVIGTWNRSGAEGGGSGDTTTSWDVSDAGDYGLLIHSDGGPTPLMLIAADSNDNPALSIYAQNTAIEARGRIVLLDRSGVTTVPAGANRVIISPLSPSMDPITPSTLALATVQQTAGGAMVRAAVPNASQETFTIYLNKTATVRTTVAWTLVN